MGTLLLALATNIAAEINHLGWPMKILPFVSLWTIFLMAVGSLLPARAEQLGELFWEPGMTQSRFGEVRNGKYVLIETLPVGGRAEPCTQTDAIKSAIIDSGVASKHPQLSGHVAGAIDFTGEGTEDISGHGTAVALIAIARAFNKDIPIFNKPSLCILSAKVVDSTERIREDNVIKAIKWAAAQGAATINLSLGFKGTLAEHRMLCDVIRLIGEEQDIIVHAAAGNYGPDVDVYPAKCPLSNVISVGARNPTGGLEPWSGRGKYSAPSSTPFIEEWFYYYQKAEALRQDGKATEARQLYQLSLSVEPNAESEFGLGTSDLSEDAYDKALLHFKRAIQLNPGLPEAHDAFGSVLFLKGEYSKAERPLREALLLYPDGPRKFQIQRARAHLVLWFSLILLDRVKDAQLEFLQVSQLNPRHEEIQDLIADFRQRCNLDGLHRCKEALQQLRPHRELPH
jgi:tetratricopeptide (TPR) repeat protein